MEYRVEINELKNIYEDHREMQSELLSNALSEMIPALEKFLFEHKNYQQIRMKINDLSAKMEKEVHKQSNFQSDCQ